MSEKQEVISGKATPIDQGSRPQTSASDRKEDDTKSPTPLIESKITTIETTTSIVTSKSETIDKDKNDDDNNDSDLIGMQIATGSTIHGVYDIDTEKAIATSERNIDDSDTIHDKEVRKVDPSIMKESRSKSVASISVFGSEKLQPSVDLPKIAEVSKDDSNLTGVSRKTSDISTLIDDVKKMDEKISSKSVVEKVETTTTTITTTSEHGMTDEHKLSQQKSAHSSLESTASDKGSIETVLDGSARRIVEHPAGAIEISKDVSLMKSETKIYRDSDNESGPISDDEAITSSQKYSYEDFQLERSNSELSKKSLDLDIDDSQNDIPPQYGSQEFKSAISVSTVTAHAMDPMSASFYGELPKEIEMRKSSPTSTVTTVRTVITKQTDQPDGDSDSSGCITVKTVTTTKTSSDDHKFLDEADFDFEKALEEHRQVRGTDVMSTVTSKYDLPLGQLDEAAAAFPLGDVKVTTKEQPKTETILSAEALARQLEDDLKKAEERVASWGKPLGLPASINENPPTPKKERKITSAKTKLNNEKNLQRRANSPNKTKKATPVYMDLTYVPHNGNSYYSNVEFFKRVRARYYVFSGTEPSRDVYNALLEAKQTWEDESLGEIKNTALSFFAKSDSNLFEFLPFFFETEVTIIPTYDTDVLGYWVAENEEMLAKCHIDLSPSASRCTINLQDHETCCSAYRLEF